MLKFSLPLLVTLTVTGPADAVEPWADGTLPIQDGLLAWYDARTLTAANTADVSLWRDGSGNKHDARPLTPEGSPRLDHEPASSGDPFVRFDGADDALIAGPLKMTASLTVFLIARPRSNLGEFRGLIAGAQHLRNDYVTGFNIDLGPTLSDRWTTLNVESAGAGGMANLLTSDRPFAKFHLIALTFDPKVGIRASIDGQPAGQRPWTGGQIHLDQLLLGARSYRNEPGPAYLRGFLDGDLAEVILYRRPLSDDERTKIESYLRDKHAGLGREADAPAADLQMIVPGFSVHKLPLDMTNINDLTYDDQGRLWLLGYDGRVHIATDTNGDSLEDKIDNYWDRSTILSPLAIIVRPDGVYVSARGKVCKLVDDDGDGRADREVTVVSDWSPPENASGGVDALGMAFDQQGNLFLALGCADFTDAYLAKAGKARYSLTSERGTILKITPDGKRTIVCTGVRFPVALAFNSRGDLFATDQEGETWLPGGNPLDELLHIRPGRHFGFPPRHDVHLPDVVDTPAVALYGPQHQSTCGLSFNNSESGRRSFGPDYWQGDAFVTGYSRGKIWRTKLIPFQDSYVSHTQLIASARYLLIDAVVSPQGDLVVAGHSGQPDWGRGPTGPGALWKIQYTNRDLPQAMMAWAESPVEVHVAFDRPVPEGWVKEASIEYGVHVRAGDRFEFHRPGYESVRRQLQSQRRTLPVDSHRLSPDRRQLLLTTHPHAQRARYALTLRVGDEGKEMIDLDYELNGVERRWHDADGKTVRRDWRPHPDAEVSAQLLPGILATDDDDPPPAQQLTRVERADSSSDPLPLTAYRLAWEPTLLPEPAISTVIAADADLAGDWHRGQRIFYSEESQCGHCHQVRGRGATIGPDLSNLIHRDVASVRRDITDPNAAVNPDYIPLTLVLASGEVVTGLTRPAGKDQLIVTDASARQRTIAHTDVDEFKTSTTSIMPTGIADKLGPVALRDLMTFLTQPESATPTSAGGAAPPSRRRADVDALMNALPAMTPEQIRPLNIVLVAGPKDHGPGEHDYPRWQSRWAELLSQGDQVRISTAQEWPSRDQIDLADVLVLYFWNHQWTKERYNDLDRYMNRGGGIVVIHSATIADQQPETLAEWIGIAYQPGPSKYRHGRLTLEPSKKDHPITRGFSSTEFLDETYWNPFGLISRIDSLATAIEEGEPRPILWTYERGRGRVFASILGHYLWTFDDPVYRTVIFRGIAWAARQPEARLQSLATIGVTFQDD